MYKPRVFFPAKPLGCYGDGGAVLTNDSALNDLLRSLRFHGRSDTPFDSDHIGLNSRLDTLQAAILLPKLAVFEHEIARRNVIAQRYSDALRPSVSRVPKIEAGVISTWAQYTLEVPNAEEFSTAMKAKAVPTARYYPLPIHLHAAYQDFPIAGNGLPNTMVCRHHVVSLPMHAYLSEEDQEQIVKAAIDVLQSPSRPVEVPSC